MTVVSVGDLITAPARQRRADWMHRYDFGAPLIPHPRPQIPGRIARPDDPCPAPAVQLAGTARQVGWHVRLIYSRGTKMDARGRAGRTVDVVSVRCWRFPDQRAVVLWDSPAGKDSWAAEAGWVWLVGQIPVDYGVAAAKDWIVKNVPPVRIANKPASDKGACQICAAMIGLNKDGTLRVHGPKADRCHGSRRIPLAR